MTRTTLTPDLLTVRQTGMVGQEIVSPRGKAVAWTVNAVLGQFVCRTLNEYLTTPDPAAVKVGEEVAR